VLVSGPRPYTALSALASLAIQRRSWLEGGREGSSMAACSRSCSPWAILDW